MQRFFLVGLLLVSCLSLSTLATSCTNQSTDPASARRDRVEARLRSTLSAVQARCVIDRLDTQTLAVLDRDGSMSSSDPAFAVYSSAVRTCVVSDATSASQGAPGSAVSSTTTTSRP
jgi:hypothetical protein